MSPEEYPETQAAFLRRFSRNAKSDSFLPHREINFLKLQRVLLIAFILFASGAIGLWFKWGWLIWVGPK